MVGESFAFPFPITLEVIPEMSRKQQIACPSPRRNTDQPLERSFTEQLVLLIGQTTFTPDSQSYSTPARASGPTPRGWKPLSDPGEGVLLYLLPLRSSLKTQVAQACTGIPARLDTHPPASQPVLIKNVNRTTARSIRRRKRANTSGETAVTVQFFSFGFCIRTDVNLPRKRAASL
ncbi:hypothetical protein SKAU_G00255000 [Synaphobranchus kaupii]|uniref:Uncharacterized protein n=1 Tax=Synaphobranchus kaupii TaxID=118154 RepID=A0A9Q1F3K8_SYNKA|nr:hypothetical protein SKAU_G00255000 [Synaphobranchus kaupii]